MKIAFVHDRIIFNGWAEKVLQDLIKRESFSEATIFTLYANQKEIKISWKSIKISSAIPVWIIKSLQRLQATQLPVIKTIADYRNFMVIYPILTTILSLKIKKYHPDKITISSFAAVKNCEVESIPTTLYLHSPMQYIRENYEEYKEKFSFPIKQIFIATAFFLRKRDKKPRNYEKIFFNSEYTAKCAKKIYNLEWAVLYPKIEKEVEIAEIVSQPENYFLFMGRVVKFVREVDKIIALANRLNIPLVIMGDWPDKKEMQKWAWASVIFTPRIKNRAERYQVLSKAKGLINITKESFGISTAESLCCGVPVFWLNEWATPELVNSENWVLIDKKDIDSLSVNFVKFSQKKFDRQAIKENFIKKLKKHSNR